MPFELTRHAKQRLEERGILDPNMARMKAVSKKMRGRIRAACKGKGYDPTRYVYFLSGSRTVYVAVCKDVDRYILITAFELELENDNVQNQTA